MRINSMTAILIAGIVAGGAAQSGRAPQAWPSYAADNAATHYSPLADVTPANVGQLAVAWEWYPTDKPNAEFSTQPGNFQNTPLMIDNVLYVSTMYNRVAALDADTGKELWSFDPKAHEDRQPPNGTGFVHRGVAAWTPSAGSGPSGQAKARIFLNSRWRLIA